jgi:hypothetical protein
MTANNPNIFYLVTSHQNMLYMLAAGMVMSPAGFRNKYYADNQDHYPGWIPLFRTKAKIPAEAVNYAIHERKHLLPCVAAFDLSGLSGSAQVLSSDGNRKTIKSLPAKMGKDKVAILVHAPLPLTLLSCISFRSFEEQEGFIRLANDVSNIGLSPYQLNHDKSLFPNNKIIWPPIPQKQTQEQSPQKQAQEELPFSSSETDPLQSQIEDIEQLHTETGNDVFPAFGQALGGVLAMLYHLANRSHLGVEIFRWAIKPSGDKQNIPHLNDPILTELSHWLKNRQVSENADTRAQLFWGAINALVNSQAQRQPETPIDVILEYLDSQLNQLQEKKLQDRLDRLITDMHNCLDFGGGTITELFERNEGTLSRPLLLFCLREDCSDLLEFTHPSLNDEDYLLVGILFGVRDGWLRIPKEFRDPDLAAYVTYRMAEVEHRKQGDDLSTDQPPFPKPLRELFTSPSGEWDSTQEEAAIELASQCDWSESIQTLITPVGNNSPENDGQKELQVLPGRGSAILEVNRTVFEQHLAEQEQLSSPLKKLFTSLGEEWNRHDLTLDFSRNCGWNDCIHTLITPVDDGIFGHHEREGSHTVLPGEMSAVVKVDKTKFLHHLGQWPPISREIESEIRKKFENAQGMEEQAKASHSSCE